LVLPFGIKAIDRHLPGGGLALGALHEAAGGGYGAIDSAAPALFTAGIAARTRGTVLWCITRPDLFAPALAQAGLMPNRVIYVEAGDEKAVLICFEEGLRHRGLGAVVAEVARLSMTASRRLQLAAEGSGTIGIAIRRWRRMAEAADFGQPTASVTRWRVSALPSTPLPVPGVGRPRWQLELIRSRAGESADFEVETCDANGRLALPSDLLHGRAEKDIGRRRASG
jgi:protein ImuA